MQTTENTTGETSMDNGQPRGVPAAARRTSRRRWWTVALGAVAVAGLTFSVARAQAFGGHGPFMMKERMEHALSAAGATDAQKTQIHAIWDGLRPQLKPLRHQAVDLRRQIGEAIAAPTIDKGRVEALRVYQDDSYPAIIGEIFRAMRAVMPTSRVGVIRKNRGANCVVVHSASKAWPCLFPQRRILARSPAR